MRNLIASLVILTATSITTFAANGPVSPVEALNVFKTAEVEFYVYDAANKDFFSYANFNDVTDNVEFVTKDDIKYIQIFKQNGKLQYQLPVMSNKLKISRKMFEQGTYKIGFIVEGGESITFSNLKFN